MRSGCLALLLLMSAAGAMGCAVVRPWQRERLAGPCMTRGFGEAGFAGEYRAKVLESRLGGGAPGAAAGGGCGCTQ